MKKTSLVFGLIVALTSLQAFAANSLKACDTNEEAASMKASATKTIASTAAEFGGKLVPGSVTMASYIPKSMLPPETAATVAVATITMSNDDGSDTQSSQWVVQFSVDEETCTPILESLSKLE